MTHRGAHLCAQYGPNIADYSNEERMEYKLRFFQVGDRGCSLAGCGCTLAWTIPQM